MGVCLILFSRSLRCSAFVLYLPSGLVKMFGLPFPSAFAIILSLVHATPSEQSSLPPIKCITEKQWNALNSSVGGRLHAGYPFAKPCYGLYNGKSSPPNANQCSSVEEGYDVEAPISSNFGAYMNENWASCQAKSQNCVLDFLNPNNSSYFSSPHSCFQGSVPDYYIDVHEVSDVQAALKFAAVTGVPLVIKNAGHDYKGRSSAPNSLALWMHNVQPSLTRNQDFTPEGCSNSAGDSITMGTGQGFAGMRFNGQIVLLNKSLLSLVQVSTSLQKPTTSLYLAAPAQP